MFNHPQFGELRTVEISGEPWFVGKDVAEALGYSNARKAVLVHVDAEDKGVTKWDTLGGTQQMTIINESGLYSLILSSKLPSAKGSSTGLQVKFERQGDIVKGGENFTLPDFPMII